MPRRKPLPMPPPERQILSVTDAAGLVGVGESTLRGLVRTGKLPHTRIGKRILITRGVLMRFFDPVEPGDHADRPS
jgi:excisionase family DNA binding protein